MTAKWIADIRVGCVAVYDGTRVNCLSGITESPHCIFYRHGRWVEDNKPGCGHWEVDPQDEETAVSLARKLNSHDALVAALKELTEWAALRSDWAQNGLAGEEPAGHPITKARAALQQAEG